MQNYKYQDIKYSSGEAPAPTGREEPTEMAQTSDQDAFWSGPRTFWRDYIYHVRPADASGSPAGGAGK